MKPRAPHVRRPRPGRTACLSALLALVAGAGASATPSAPGGQARVLARDGQSAYAIFHATNAPGSVREAAALLQRVLKQATGAELPIVHAPREAMIALGDTPESRAAGLDGSRMPEEGFRMATRGPSIWITGHDTGDGARTKDGGCSDGTFHGALDFLERVAGVRWLMPGPWGEDIPAHAVLEVPDLDRADAPDFRYRMIHMSWGNTITDPWKRLQRVDVGRQPFPMDYNHAWTRYGIPERLKGHPEYMALVKGKRPPIEAWQGPEPWKLCTTHPDVPTLVADCVLAAMAVKPEQRMWSIAPQDGGAWCECAACTALDERGGTSITRRIFTFYNAVARRVAARQPGKILGCFAYAAYTYPPEEPMAVESNLFVMLAARSYYGFSLYHPELARDFVKLVDDWNARLPGRLGWCDFSTSVGLGKCSVGAPYPVGAPILKLIFPDIKKKGWPAVFWASSYVQGYGSLNTYLVARLLWDADADVDALQREWLERAYGPAAEPMGRLYALLDHSLARYKQAFIDTQYRCVPQQVKAVHLPVFPEMESLYREAMRQDLTPRQQARLEMFGDNLVLLHWNMRKAGWLAEPEKSVFHRSDAAFRTFAESRRAHPSISLSAGTELEFLLRPQLGQEDKGTASRHD